MARLFVLMVTAALTLSACGKKSPLETPPPPSNPEPTQELRIQ